MVLASSPCWFVFGGCLLFFSWWFFSGRSYLFFTWCLLCEIPSGAIESSVVGVIRQISAEWLAKSAKGAFSSGTLKAPEIRSFQVPESGYFRHLKKHQDCA